MIHWQVDPRSRISIPLQVPAKNEARNEWRTCSLLKNSLRIATYLSTATPRAKRARVATLRSSCFELIVCYFSVSVLATNSPFLSSVNGKTHKPQLSVRVSYFTKRPQSTNLPSVSGVPQDGSIFPSDPSQGDQTQSVGVWSARECINKSLRGKKN